MKPSSDTDKRSVIFSFVILLLLGGFVAIDSGSVVGAVLGNSAGVGGGAVGLAVAAGLIAKRATIRVRPLAAFGIAISSIALYFLLRSVLFQLDSVRLPAYLPSAWVAFISHGMLGLLIGAGVPLLLFALVAEGYRLLE